jgi:putative ABC transport system permease protein
MIIIIFITSLGVWNTMTISVMERTGEIGVLRAMGMKRLSAVALFVLEAMMIGILGGVLGVILGGIPAYYLEVVGVSIGEDVIENMDANTPFSRILRADLNGFVVGITFMTALSMSLVGSALPSLRAALIQPVEAMRARR